MNAPKLCINGKKTASCEKLIDGLTPEGASVVRRGKGFSDFNVINRMVAIGWMESRRTGPRGGERYYTTKAGEAALSAAEPDLAQMFDMAYEDQCRDACGL